MIDTYDTASAHGGLSLHFVKEKLLGTSATHTVPSMTDQTDQMHSCLTHTALTVFKLSVVLRIFLRQQFRNQNHNKNCRLNDPT